MKLKGDQSWTTCMSGNTDFHPKSLTQWMRINHSGISTPYTSQLSTVKQSRCPIVSKFGERTFIFNKIFWENN